MLQSMTGFASKDIVIETAEGSSTISLLLKSLNGRYLETQCRLPHPLSSLETDLIKLFKHKLQRGSIIFSVQMSNPNIFKSTLKPDLHTIQSYCNAALEIQKKTNIPGTFTISDLMRKDDIFIAEEKMVDAKTQQQILRALDTAIEQLIATRQEEGAALQKDLEQRCAKVSFVIEKIAQRAEEVMAERKKSIGEKLAELEEKKEVNEQILASQRSALYYELDKIDIHEEIVRFKNHVATIYAILKSNEIEKGRRLDFTLQELGREINTIAAKCSDSTISSHAIDIKVELEKAREQVQNVV